MHNYLISIGSNTSDSHDRVRLAIGWLGSAFTLGKISEIYSTPDIKDPAASPYHNAVAQIETAMEPDSLNAMLKAYECSQHREHGTGRVTIDLDAVTCDHLVLRPRDYLASYFLLGLYTLAPVAALTE